MLSSRTRLVLTLLFVLWLFFVLASFFAVQKPFSTANALAIGRDLLDLLTAGWLALVALAVGSWLLARLRLTDLPLLETLVLGSGLGFGVLGLLGLFFGLAGLLRPDTGEIRIGGVRFQDDPRGLLRLISPMREGKQKGYY